MEVLKAIDRRRWKREEQDRRHFPRYRTPIPMVLKEEKEPSWSEICQVIDISKSGVKIRARHEAERLSELNAIFFTSNEQKNGFRVCSEIGVKVISSSPKNIEGFSIIGLFFLQNPQSHHCVDEMIKYHI